MSTETDQGILTRYAPHYPKGHPGQLRAGATAWRQVAKSLSEEQSKVAGYINTCTPDWQGTAADNCHDEWKAINQGIDELVNNIYKFASAIDDLANQIEGAQLKYKAAMVTAGVEVTIGAVFTVLTFGGSDVLAGTAAASTLTAAVTMVEGFAAIAAEAFGTIAGLAVECTALFAVGFAVDFVGQSVGAAFVYPDHNPLSHLDLQAMVESGISFAAFGPIARGLSFVQFSKPLANVAFQAAGLGLSNAGLSALQEAVTTRSLDPGQIFFAGVTGTVIGFFGARRSVPDVVPPKLLGPGPQIKALPAGRPIGSYLSAEDFGLPRLDTPYVVTVEQRAQMLRELQVNGVKHDATQIVYIGRRDGRVVFLELGDPVQGLESRPIVPLPKERDVDIMGLRHIHYPEFLSQDVPHQEIPKTVFQALLGGKLLKQGPLDTFYIEYDFANEKRIMMIRVADNGFILGANPKSRGWRPK